MTAQFHHTEAVSGNLEVTTLDVQVTHEHNDKAIYGGYILFRQILLV